MSAAGDTCAATENDRKTIVVVGLGMVGIAFIEKVLNLDEAGRYRIVTCGEEIHLAYNRVALTDYFQHRNVEKLYLNDAAWYTQQDPNRFVFHVGEAVNAINTETHTVITDKGRNITYDYCVLATGSDATIPDYVDPSIPGVFVYRNIADLNKLLAYAERDDIRGGKATVIGGGLLGLEAAKAVYDLEAISTVSIIHRGAYPLSRQLDALGGEIVQRRIENMGVTVLLNTSIKRLFTNSEGVLTGLELHDGTIHETDIVIFSIGITPRDDIARSSGITCETLPKHGIVVDDYLNTSAQDVFAIGECACWKGNTYGLIAPGVEMADILSFNLTQVKTEVGEFKRRQMNPPDLSTKLKLMGVDVASFGDFFAEQRFFSSVKSKSLSTTTSVRIQKPASSSSGPSSQDQTISNKPRVWEITPTGSPLQPSKTKLNTRADASSPRKRHGAAAAAIAEGPVETLTYRDPFAGVYKKYIFSADGKYILGGMMVGDTSDYIKLVSLVKKKKALEVPPSQFIVGSNAGGEESGADLDDDTQICSCHNVTKGAIAECVKSGVTDLGDIKKKTKAGTGCGGCRCIPLLTSIFKNEMAKAGVALNNNLCPHFAMSRADIFDVVRKNLKTLPEIMSAIGVKKDAVGCEVCKPAIGSILSSLFNEHVMIPAHHSNQDTNDRFMANIQRNGTFSVIPRVAAGEITPDKLIVLGQVAKKYGLYTKITGGQRVDLFGAEKADLPSIWKELVDAGFESGHAYGKALRTVKSCVGTSWCRYGIGDSVGMAIELENRYKGIRSPHKFKGGVSGCVRECAEAQSKDFGLIATDKGWNIFVCGNGGATPRHATLLATDVPPSKVIRILDRFIMYYIRTADKLMRTARWLENMDGGIEKLKKVILEDSLGICEDLEREMDTLVGTYYDEWQAVVANPERQKQFRQFVNTDERRLAVEQIAERGHLRPANWAKSFPSLQIRTADIATAKEAWKWRKLARIEDLSPSDVGTTSAAVRYGDSQLAIFHVPHRGYYATQQMCPHKRAFVLEHGIIGDDPNSGAVYVSCPMHKRNFTLTSGECLNDDSFSILAFDVKVEDGDILLLLPEPDELDAVIGTSKWMVRQGTAEALDRGGGGSIEIVGPGEEGVSNGGCGTKDLEW
ncbi:nitrite reductase [Abortiporus biennis]|nr:nitrite reductase [Abortiporus biennis]